MLSKQKLLNTGIVEPESKLELTKMEAFGDETLDINHEWPAIEDLKNIPKDTQVKLNRISYKH